MSREIDLLSEFASFISRSRSGKRLQKNGKKVVSGVIEYYTSTYKYLQEFSEQKNFRLRIVSVNGLSAQELAAEKHYWKKFYMKFTDFMFKEKNCFDNYVGILMRVLKTFFNYLNEERLLSVGTFHRQFYARKEEIPIITLLPEQLSFLIFDEAFEASLSLKQRRIKSIFVFGCTVGLRFSDLRALKASNIMHTQQGMYLSTTSKKTGTLSQVKLPPYALDILKEYGNIKKKRTLLFDIPALDSFNDHLRSIGEKAGWTQEIPKLRSKRGEKKVIYRDGKTRSHYRFCDLMSSHMMRRTTITNLLSLGVPETMVRRVSGHVGGSKDFHRYVNFAQVYLDQETEKAYEKLSTRYGY